MTKHPNIGSSFDDFLEEEGTLKNVDNPASGKRDIQPDHQVARYEF